MNNFVLLLMVGILMSSCTTRLGQQDLITLVEKYHGVFSYIGSDKSDHHFYAVRNIFQTNSHFLIDKKILKLSKEVRYIDEKTIRYWRDLLRDKNGERIYSSNLAMLSYLICFESDNDIITIVNGEGAFSNYYTISKAVLLVHSKYPNELFNDKYIDPIVNKEGNKTVIYWNVKGNPAPGSGLQVEFDGSNLDSGKVKIDQ